jgi:hypothetical protein
LLAGGTDVVRNSQQMEDTMKTIASALIVLSLLVGLAAPASAVDAKSFYEQQDRQSGGTAN